MKLLSDLEKTNRLKRIQIWLDDMQAFDDEAKARADSEGRLTSFEDNEWLWNESQRVLHIAYELLRDTWLNGLEPE